MSVWDEYRARMEVIGNNRRSAHHNRGAYSINSHLPNSLSYFDVTIDGIDQTVAIMNSDNLNEKTIISLPGEDVRHGGLVHWMDQYWLITEKDYNTVMYGKGYLLQCNFILKWITEDGVIHEQWCCVEDGTKYLTGEMEDRNFTVTRGDSRIAVTIAKNDDTAKLNRESRFLIDDPKSPKMLSYLLTKPLKLGMNYGDDGVYKFVLQEVTATADDNFELQIADYYKYFPKNNDSSDNTSTDNNSEPNGKKVWL